MELDNALLIGTRNGRVQRGAYAVENSLSIMASLAHDRPAIKALIRPRTARSIIVSSQTMI